MALSPLAKFAAKHYDGGGAVFNVMHPSFGAVGDGVTDDTAAFQACENARAAVRGTLYIPAGDFRIEGTVTASASDIRWESAPGAVIHVWNDEGPAFHFGGASAFIEHLVLQGLRIYARVAAHRVPMLTIGNSHALERFVIDDMVLDANNFARTGILMDRVWEGSVRLVNGLNFSNGVLIEHQATDLNAGNIHFDSVISTTAPILFLFNEYPGQGNLTNSLLFTNCKTARSPSAAANKFYAGTSDGVVSIGATSIPLTAGQGANYVAGDWIICVSISGNRIFVDKVAGVSTDTLALTNPDGLPFALAANDPVVAGYWHTILGPNIRQVIFSVPHFERTNGVFGSGALGVRIDNPLLGTDVYRGAYLANNCQGWKMESPMQDGVNLASSAIPFHVAGDSNNAANTLCGNIKVTGPTVMYQVDAPASASCLRDQLGGTNTLLGVWHQDSTVSASQSDVQLTGPSGAARSLRMRSRGAIAAMVVQVATSRAAGTLTATVFKNGSATGFTAVINGSNTTWKVTEQVTTASLVSFAPGDTIDVRVTTDGSWAPTSNNLDVSLYAAC